MTTSARSKLTFWHEDAGTDRAPEEVLDRDLQVDVAIVGAGYTGLWTAYHLAAADPTLRIAVLEKEFVGFGASGRNATAPLPEEVWAQIGLADRATFSDKRHLRIHGRRVGAPPSVAGVRPTTSRRGWSPGSTTRRGSTPCSAASWSSCSRPSGRSAPRMRGAATWGSPGTGSPR
jgi:hypothetical protein